MAISPELLVLPAFTTADYAADPDDPDEVTRWLDARDFERHSLGGVPKPVRYDPGADVALVPTGIGKSAAAATVSALCADDALALDEATLVTVGIAGAHPSAGTVGSVVVADSVVDWDLKERVDGRVSPLSWRARDYVWDLDDSLVDRVAGAARDADLADSEAAQALRASYDDDRSPGVTVGPTVCGDEVWHGESAAADVERLCEACGVDGYATAEMEDAGTATALERFDALDRYVSLRAISNFDRAPPGGDPAESAGEFRFDLATENAFRAGRAVVSAMVE
jgi:purine nucleoside permease